MNLEDIARLAGVSRSTAGHVLRGNARKLRISSETEQKVREIAESRGYLANFTVKQLKSRKTYQIGIIVTSYIPQSTLSPFIVSIMNHLQSYDYQTTIIFVDAKTMDISPFFKERRFDGIVVDGIVPNWAFFKEWSDKHNIPCVFLNHENMSCNAGGIDEKTTAYRVIDALYSEGYRKMAFYFPRTLDSNPLFPDDFIFARERYLREAIRAKGLKLYPDTVEQRKHGENTTRYLMSLPDPPDCVIGYNDFHGIEFKRYLSEMGLSAPEDVALLVYSFSEFNKAARIAGIYFDVDGGGRALAEMLLKKIDGNKKMKNRLVSGSLVTEYANIHLDSMDHFKKIKREIPG